jgi:hypothetical protein
MALLHYVIGLSAGWAAPTAAEVIAGTLAGGGASAAHGSETAPTVTTAPFTFSATATGLDAGTAYFIAFAWTDGTLTSNVAVSNLFTTAGGAIRAAIPAGSLMPAYRARTAALSTAARPRT